MMRAIADTIWNAVSAELSLEESMFTSFSVERFRGLSECTVAGMRRVTLLTGKNNTGKTALLEAMFVHTGQQNPHLMMVVNAIRGLSKFALEAMPEGDAPWKSIFWNYDDQQSIKLVGEVVGKSHLDLVTVVLSTIRPGTELAGLGNQLRAYNLLDNSGPTRVLKVEIVSGRKAKPIKHFLVIDNKRQVVIPPPTTPEYQARLISAHHRDSPEEIATLFSRFVARGQVDVLIEALRPIEPRLKEIDLLFSGEPVLHRNIGLKQRFIPIALMGDGLNRVAALVLAIGATPGGVVLVDDIDTGIHHSVMESFWQSVFHAADQFNAQVVATTHSDECVRGALEAAAKSKMEKEFSLVRLEQRGDDTKAFTYDSGQLDIAFDANLEVR